ncbi:helix-turn-helix domain-containing protein [uncultured Kordia sp.]|uniref:helix-turn-helix domain-containing protein n=1 Tax=uncultured Kordia sp. TaxID=507699 RepID=UPI002628DE65|nr:helix-turn-helix domain-containing protein [uncultured Kordia sp.]
MKFLPQIVFFLGAIGVFNSLIICGYFLFSKSRKNSSNRIFGIFLLVLSLRVLKSLFYAFAGEKPIWFLQHGPAYFLLIGPLLLTYILSCVKPTSNLLKYWKAHLLFWILIVTYLVIFIPFPDNVEFNKKTLLPIINLQWLLFIIISGFVIKPKVKNFKNNPVLIKWLTTLVLGILILWLSYFFIQYDYFVSGSIIFSILFYTFFLFFLFNKKIALNIFPKAKKTTISKTTNETEKLVVELKKIMTTQKLYTNPNLKLSNVASHLNISTHELSRLLNENVGENFTDFINKYRIKEAKVLIKENLKYTLEAIGNQSGFNSKSAFYKAFKKFTNMTPAKYKSQL